MQAARTSMWRSTAPEKLREVRAFDMLTAIGLIESFIAVRGYVYAMCRGIGTLVRWTDQHARIFVTDVLIICREVTAGRMRAAAAELDCEQTI